MADPKVQISRRQNYACIMCGKCCRRFYVAIREEEIRRLRALNWGSEKDVPDDFVTRIHGYTYFSRSPDGGCVFLDAKTGLCRMHARFGYERKALSCRGYPLNIASTFPGEVSVIARMDCPAVSRNQGKPLERRLREAEGMVREMGIRGGFTDEQREGLTRDAIEAITGALADLIEDESLSPSALALALLTAARRFQQLGTAFLNDQSTLREILPSLLERVRADAADPGHKDLSAFSRAILREWLAAYCRRDEEPVHTGVWQRLRRTFEFVRYFFGFGSFGLLGREHPEARLQHCRLFPGPGDAPPLAEARARWAPFRLLLLSRLDAFQFFGVTYYDQPFFTGLRAVLQSYVLVLAAARYRAGALSRRDLHDEDVLYGVEAVDHCLGRSPLLQLGMWRTIEGFFAGPRYPRTLVSLGWE